MVTIGLSSVLKAVIQMLLRHAPRDAPKILPTGNIELLGATVPINRLIVIGIAAIVLVAFAAFFQRSPATASPCAPSPTTSRPR